MLLSDYMQQLRGRINGMQSIAFGERSALLGKIWPACQGMVLSIHLLRLLASLYYRSRLRSLQDEEKM